MRGNGNNPIGGQERAQYMGVPQGIGLGELSQHPGRHAEVDADCKDVPTPSPAPRADDQFLRGETGHQGINHRKCCGSPLVKNRAATNLNYVGVG
jgi:hypothetical protein